MPNVDVQIFAEIFSNEEVHSENVSDEANDFLDNTSNKIFNKTFPVVKDRGYTMMVSVVINGEMVSHDKKFVKIDK